MTARNRRPGALLRLAAVGACALALSGCISLLPKSKPAQLYRFEATATKPAAPAAGGQTVGVFRATGLFQRESAGDRLLTLRGERAAYIAQARWVAPAQVLWEQEVLDAFDASGGPVRLVSRGEPVQARYALRLDVRNFEARYDGRGAPTVVVRVRAALTNVQSRAEVNARLFEAEIPAGDNRVSAIVAAYDKALGQVLGDIVAWTNGAVA